MAADFTMTPSSISTIIFDLSEVLITGLLDIEKPLARRLGVPPDGLFAAFGGQPLTDLFRGRLTEDAYVSQLIAGQQWDISMDEMKSLIRQNFRRKIPGMENLVHGLAGKFDLILLSDHAREWAAHIKMIHPFLEVFGSQFYSFQIGQTKSDPSTFTKVLSVTAKRPEECLFIDDWVGNIAAAEKAGIKGIQFVNADNLSEKLSAVGVLTDPQQAKEERHEK